MVGLLCGYHQRGAFLVNQEHKEFCRLCTTGIPANDVNIAGIFIKALAWSQREFLFPLSPASQRNPPAHKQTPAHCGGGQGSKSPEESPRCTSELARREGQIFR